MIKIRPPSQPSFLTSTGKQHLNVSHSSSSSSSSQLISSYPKSSISNKINHPLLSSQSKSSVKYVPQYRQRRITTRTVSTNPTDNATISRPKQFLGYFRCCCYRWCSCICECSIPPNTIQNQFTKYNQNSSRSSLSSSKKSVSSSLSLSRRSFYFNILYPLIPIYQLFVLTKTALANTSYFLTNHTVLSFTSDNFTLLNNNYYQHHLWHAGCCIRRKAEYLYPMCDNIFFYNYQNETSTFLFDGITALPSNFRTFHSSSLSNNMDMRKTFLYNQTLFCERYDMFRHLLLTQLGIFTYVVVIVGIILNICVLFVLICGSLRRSTSFTLFVALTCFDLLSLASVLFGHLFRSIMTYLKTSAPFCKMFGIFFLYFRQCSSTTLLLIAIERCLVIKHPLCRHTFDKFRVPFLLSIMIMYIIPVPFDFLFFTSGNLHCEAFDSRNADRYQLFRGFFTVLSYAIVPFVGISISNLLIIIELKKSKERFTKKNDNGTMRRFSSHVMDTRGTTVMLLVASLAFLLLLGPFYIHWVITYLFHYYHQCQFTRNIYENVQVCMGVLNPYLTVIEKGMRESNHAVNFLLYWATSSRFRLDFKRLIKRLMYRYFGSCLLFFGKKVCCYCVSPSCRLTLERHLSDIQDDSSYDSNRKNQAAYKTSHYHTNFERRRQHQLLTSTLLNNNSVSTPTSTKHLANLESKSVRILQFNPWNEKFELDTPRVSDCGTISNIS
ncbi:unnamed protein product [Didymodactylos carnosus]|uniref:G-protein coupled receptors family 1 profile domain-containing protein n=1 Tax=Didymodactylos carnosus TaxID=1234261 RepID=A0A813SMS4_9BILA|nr:unnamed protein product [Didymodactylos carnosus]CAF0877274.1 unnamed protein product [Didymodactylos carnosus]CAF3582946.1 unnamed protein product [Didymodactylos carnosus]CAF3661494.1 unnamed protein product [Didymodactylos carnosus]